MLVWMLYGHHSILGGPGSGSFEHMVFVSEGATGAEAEGTVLPWSVGVPAEFDIQAVVGAAEAEGLQAEVVGASIEVWSWMEGGVELAESGQFG